MQGGQDRKSRLVAGLMILCATSIAPACLADDAPSAAAIDRARVAPQPVAMAMRASVLIERRGSTYATGSGVVLKIRDQVAWIATARHVVDASFFPPSMGTSDTAGSHLFVTTIDGAQTQARLEWLAPHGLDLAIVSATVSGDEVREARWDLAGPPKEGDEVFAVGNWSNQRWVHTGGILTQVREARRDGYDWRVLQSRLALAPGDSGGGLYEKQGLLIGIHSQAALRTADLRVAGGIALSTSLSTLLDLAPASFGVTGQVGK